MTDSEDLFRGWSEERTAAFCHRVEPLLLPLEGEGKNLPDGRLRIAGYQPGWRSGRGHRAGGSRGARRRRMESTWGWRQVGSLQTAVALWRARECNRVLSPRPEPGLFMVDGRKVVRRPRQGKLPYRLGFYISARGQHWERRGGAWTRARTGRL